RPLLAEAPAVAAGAGDRAAVLPAGRLRAFGVGDRDAGAVSAVLDAGVSAELTDAVQRRDAARAALQLLLARLARRSPGGDLRPLHRRGAALQVLRRNRPRVPPGALA